MKELTHIDTHRQAVELCHLGLTDGEVELWAKTLRALQYAIYQLHQSYFVLTSEHAAVLSAGGDFIKAHNLAKQALATHIEHTMDHLEVLVK